MRARVLPPSLGAALKITAAATQNPYTNSIKRCLFGITLSLGHTLRHGDTHKISAQVCVLDLLPVLGLVERVAVGL